MDFIFHVELYSGFTPFNNILLELYVWETTQDQTKNVQQVASVKSLLIFN